MSWRAYVDKITDQGMVNAAIYSLDGAEWAKSAKNAGTTAEVEKILAHMKSCAVNRFSYGGKDYMTLRNSGDTLYGILGAEGITFVKSGKALVVGVFDRNSTATDCNRVVEGLAEYLTESGY